MNKWTCANTKRTNTKEWTIGRIREGMNERKNEWTNKWQQDKHVGTLAAAKERTTATATETTATTTTTTTTTTITTTTT